jgi:hypothetical protein
LAGLATILYVNENTDKSGGMNWQKKKETLDFSSLFSSDPGDLTLPTTTYLLMYTSSCRRKAGKGLLPKSHNIRHTCILRFNFENIWLTIISII